MEKTTITAQSRTVSGRRVKKLRQEGILPVNLYGKNIPSQMLQVPFKEFTTVFVKVGETGLVEAVVEGKKLPVLIHNVQYDSITGQPIHADFFQVNLKEKVTAHVPIAITGESPAVRDKTGVLLTMLNEIEVEALPADLPEKIDIDITSLTEVDQVIKVSELKVDSTIKVLSDPEQDVVKIAPLVSKEAEKMAQEEQAAAAAAEAAEPTDESAAPASEAEEKTEE